MDKNERGAKDSGANLTNKSAGNSSGRNIPGRGANNNKMNTGNKPKNIPGGVSKGSFQDKAIKAALEKTPLANTKAVKTAQFAAKAAQTVATVSKSVVSFFGNLINILANPVSWIIIAAILIISFLVLNLFSFSQTIGKNDNADGCYGVGAGNSSTVVFQEGDSDMDKANKMVTWLLTQPEWEVNDGKPMEKEQAFAMVGNFLAESSLDPTIIEFSAPNREEYMGADNDRVYVWTQMHTAQGTNIGLGIVQWTWNPGRAGDLIDKARETGTQWYEIQPQLELMKDEMDGTYSSLLKGAGFNDTSKSIEELSVIFHDIYEGSADTAEMKKRRGEMAKEVAEQYVGGSSTGGRSGGSCTRGGSADMTSAVALAISIAYEPEERAKATTTDGLGMKNAKPEYLDAKKMAEEAKDADPYAGGQLFASCDRVVATIVKNTLDPEVPWGSTTEQYLYYKGSPDWEEILTKEELEPGDVLITKVNGHTAMYIGDYNGVESIVQGSYTDQVANIQADWISPKVGGEYAAFRFSGTPVRSDSSALE